MRIPWDDERCCHSWCCKEACVLTNVEDFGAFCRIFSRLNYNCQNAQSKTIGANNNGCSNSKKPIISQDMKDLYRSGLSFLETFFLWIFCSVQQCEIICLVFSLLFLHFHGINAKRCRRLMQKYSLYMRPGVPALFIYHTNILQLLS